MADETRPDLRQERSTHVILHIRGHHVRGRRAQGHDHAEPAQRAECAEPPHDHRTAHRLRRGGERRQRLDPHRDRAPGRAFCTGADVEADSRRRQGRSTNGRTCRPTSSGRPLRRARRRFAGWPNRFWPRSTASAAAQAWTGSPPATSSSRPTRRPSSIPTSASAWSPVARWCGWPGCCPATSRCECR